MSNYTILAETSFTLPLELKQPINNEKCCDWTSGKDKNTNPYANFHWFLQKKCMLLAKFERATSSPAEPQHLELVRRTLMKWGSNYTSDSWHRLRHVFYVDCVDQNNFDMSPHYTWIIHDFYVGCVGQKYFCVGNVCCGFKIFWLKIFAWVNSLYVGPTFF